MEITIPYKYSPRPYQLDYHRSNTRFKICIFHRRAGKSKMALNEQVLKAIKTKGVYYYFLPTYRQAKAVIWDSLIKEHIPLAIVSKLNESELAVYYKNGSIQRFVGAEDVDKHRGINPLDVVFDEYSEMKEEIWTTIIRPILAQNKGSATFIFTPKGKNHSWKIYEQALVNPQWYTNIKTVDDTKAIDEEEMKEIRKDTPQSVIDQEYYCRFIADATTFFRRIRENVYEANDDINIGHSFQLGVDLAKYQDWTVMTPFDLNTFKVLKQDRFNQIDWNLQKARIEASCLRHNRARVILDSTGVGDPIYEDLERQGLPMTSFKFTEVSRRQLLDNLAILLEQDRIKIPNDEGLINELESMTYVMTERHKINVRVPQGLTDDRIMSLALAVWDAKMPIVTQKSRYRKDIKIYATKYN